MTKFICTVNDLWQVSNRATSLRTLVFTVGHFFIDFFVISAVTGADIGEATLASLIAPIMNGCWYWVIDRAWTQTHMKKENEDNL